MTSQARAWVELDLANLRHNLAQIRAQLPEGCQVMAVVKADGLGHGAVAMARELSRHQVEWFCVACVDEAVSLRQAGIGGDILILGYTHPSQYPLLRRYRLTQTVVDLDHARSFPPVLGGWPVHLKADTGMRRLGEPDAAAILEMMACPNLDVRGLYSHLCAADGDTPVQMEITSHQISAFNRIAAVARAASPRPLVTHLLASYSVMRRFAVPADYARVGIGLYGTLSTSQDTARWAPGLRPVASVHARVGAVKQVRAGQGLGYGPAFTASRDMTIATISLGYADGLPRNLNGGAVLVNQSLAPLAGRICMDLMMADVTGLGPVRPGDVVTVIGRSGPAEITACQVAAQSGTIANEILSRLGERLPRVVRHASPVTGEPVLADATPFGPTGRTELTQPSARWGYPPGEGWCVWVMAAKPPSKATQPMHGRLDDRRTGPVVWGCVRCAATGGRVAGWESARSGPRRAYWEEHDRVRAVEWRLSGE